MGHALWPGDDLSTFKVGFSRGGAAQKSARLMLGLVQTDRGNVLVVIVSVIARPKLVVIIVVLVVIVIMIVIVEVIVILAMVSRSQIRGSVALPKIGPQ